MFGNMWDQFPTFWGQVSNKEIMKAGPTLFLAHGKNVFMK
jgi:hypothetical protein